MDLIYIVVLLTGLGLLAFGIRKVVQFLSRSEQHSDWYQQNVSSIYQLNFPDKERSQFENLRDRLKEKKLVDICERNQSIKDQLEEWTLKENLGSEKDESVKVQEFLEGNEDYNVAFNANLTDAETAILLNQLKNVMIKSIDNLYQLQNDRPGCYKLWRSKLISESYWESLLESHEEVKADIAEVIGEVGKIKASISDRFFDDCIVIWRRQMASQQATEDAHREKENQKEEVRQRKQEDIKLEQQNERDAKERERLAQQLIMEEAKEESISKNKKKGPNSRTGPPVSGGKRKKK